MLKTTLLIRTKNEAACIGKALDLVSEQSLLPDEIIVIDSGSTDGTVAIVEQRPEVRLIHLRPEDFTFGGSLNLGLEATSGDVVVSLSAHAFPCDRGWLFNLVSHFCDEAVAGVYGSQVAHPNAWPPVKREYDSYYADQSRRQVDPNNPSDRVFSNANSAIRRKYWQVCPFDATLTAVEDQAWAWAMLQRGHQIVYEPKASVFHSHNETLGKVMQRTYRETMALNALYDREVSIWRAAKVWTTSVWADVKYILPHPTYYSWLLWVPIYRAAGIYGCLKPSSFKGFWRLPEAMRKPKHLKRKSTEGVS